MPTPLLKRDEITKVNGELSSTNLFIEAGAGAGKSTTISEKIVSQLINDKIPPERFVVITFTNKSAEDLLSKISEVIEKKEKAGEIHGVLKNLYKMNVSTIHSFCNKLLNENSFAAKLSYAPSILEDEDETKRIEALFVEWRRTLSFEENEEIYSLRDNNPFASIKNAYSELCHLFDDTKVEIGYFDEEFVDNFLDKIVYLHNYICGKPFDHSNQMNKFLVYVENNFNNGLISIEKPYSLESLTKIKDLASNVNSNVKFKSRNDDVLRDLTDELKELKTDFEAIYKFVEQDKLAINRYALKAWEYYKANCGNQELSNNQLIYKTCQMLKDEKILKEIASKIDAIYVDEFQDTDRYQIEFVMSIARAIDKRKKEKGIKSMSLLLVGDPKQSIYRFRGADFNSFLDVREHFEENGENYKAIYFPDNYRSNDFIIDYVNDTYSNFTFVKTGSFHYENMEARKIIPPSLYEDPEQKLGGVYSFETQDHINDSIRLIKTIVESKYQIYDPKEKDFRNVRYGDFLFITTSKKEIPQYVKAFGENGVKVSVSGRVDLSGSSSIVRYVYRLFKYLTNDEKNNERAAKEIIAKYYGSSFNEEAIKSLGLSPYGLLVYLFNNFDIKQDEFSKEDEYTFLALKNQIIENLSVNINASGSELANKFEELLLADNSEEIILEENADAVRIMNDHKTKGLGQPIVFIARSGGFNNVETIAKVDNVAYLNCIKLYKGKAEQNSMENSEEKLRREYVAATRAMQVMIFEKKTGCSPCLFYRKENKYEFDEEYLEQYHIPGSSLPELDEKEETESKPCEIISSSYSELDPSLLKKQIKEVTPSSLEIKNDEVIENAKEYYRPADNIFGTALHKVMELFVLNKSEDADKIVDFVVSSIEEDIDKAKYRIYLKKCFVSIVDLFNKNHLLDNKSAYPEHKFISLEKDILANGSIDLLLMDDKEAVIIDFKSDIASFNNKTQFEELLKKTYSPQINFYEKEVKKLYPSLSISKYIVWVEEDNDNEIAHLLKI